MTDTVLITGGAGYIGSHAVYAFIDSGYKVVVIDDMSTGVRDNLPADIDLYIGNAGDPVLLDRVMQEHSPNGVLHFAGSIVVPESVIKPGKYYENNTATSLRLIEACVRNGVDNFVFSSTAAVYGLPENGVASEDTFLSPITPYGHSKLMTEQILKDMSRAYGINYAILRYFNVAGADFLGRTGQSTPEATHLIKVACEVAVGKRPSITVFGTDYDTPDGTCIRDYIHVVDLADAHLAVYRQMGETAENFTLNCGNGRGYSVLEVIRAVEQVNGRELNAVRGERRLGDPEKLVASPSLLYDRIGWRPKYTDMSDIVSTALNWEKR